jgi:hypothetical protein
VRRSRFNRGRWEVTRERCRLEDTEPPCPDASPALAGAVRRVMQRLGLDALHWLNEMETEWGELVGPDVAAHTRPGRFDRGRLTIYVDSPVWLQELSTAVRGPLTARLRQRFGPGHIRDVRLAIDPDPQPPPRPRAP